MVADIGNETARDGNRDIPNVAHGILVKSIRITPGFGSTCIEVSKLHDANKDFLMLSPKVSYPLCASKRGWTTNR